MTRRLRRALLIALAFGVVASATCELAHAAPTEASGEPLYTLEVDSDEPDVVSFEALSARISSDLGSIVVRGSASVHPQRAQIVMRYRGGQLMVRAVHADGSTVERTVTTEGDGAAVQREAVLLASNLARDEAREIIDALATKPKPEPPKTEEAPPKKPDKPAPAEADDGEVPVSAALLYPLATNAGRPHVTTHFDVSALFAHVGLVRGAQIGGAVVWASRGLSGVQVSGFGNWAGARGVSGVQVSGFANGTTGAVTGVQVSGFGNWTDGDLRGAAVSGGANVVGGSARGWLTSGGANVVLRDAKGVFVAGGANVTEKDAVGLLVAGGANVTSGEVDGAMIAGAANVAGTVNGLQLSAVNVARKVKGVQLGVINIVDDLDGVALGVVSISRHGVHPVVWGSNLHYMNAGVKFATKYIYTTTALTYGTLETKLDPVIGTTFALGGTVPIGRLTGGALGGLDTDLQAMVTTVSPEEDTRQQNTWLGGHVLPGYNFARHLRVFAGAGARFPLNVDQGRSVVRPEVMAGVQF